MSPPDISMLGEWTIVAKFPGGRTDTIPIDITSQTEGDFTGSSGIYDMEGSLWWGFDDEPVVWMTIVVEPVINCPKLFGPIQLYTFEYEMQAAPILGDVISDPDRNGEYWAYCSFTDEVEISASRS